MAQQQTQPQAKAPKYGDRPAEAKEPVQPIDRARMVPAAQVLGELMIVTLPEDQTVEEGLQDVRRWEHLGPRLTMHQFVIVTNDCGSMWRWMRVERLHGSPGAGLRALLLRDVVPPRFVDLALEPIVATGSWEVRHGGPHRRWMVIQPNGSVRRDGINSEAEARTIAHRESGNPKPI